MQAVNQDLTTAFAEGMAALGPFAPRPALAVAVSGGADSMALAILARDWAISQGGSTQAMVVDHGLRRGSTSEARVTIERLSELGIAARLLPLSNLTPGAALADRARILRYQALAEACREAGILYLLVGHHASDQAETVAMRVLGGSQTHGLAGMSTVVEIADLLLLRPLLRIEPGLLRRHLVHRDVDWVEDPSNQDTRATRARLRQRLAGAAPTGAALLRAVGFVGRMRSKEEIETAAELASRATIRPEGFAWLSPGRIGSAALSRLVRMVSGARYSPAIASITRLAADPRPAAVAGIRIIPAGRLGDGWLIVREEAAVMEPVDALRVATWDHRFRLSAPADLRAGAKLGKLGVEAAQFRKWSALPSAVLRTLPAVRLGKELVAVPHLRYVSDEKYRPMIMLFVPRAPLAGSAFTPASRDSC